MSRNSPENIKQRHDSNRAFVWAMKEAPCMDCGKCFHPSAMDFDHVRGDKKYNIGQIMPTASRARLIDEIAKCELVCSNCHRIRTYDRKNNALEGTTAAIRARLGDSGSNPTPTERAAFRTGLAKKV